MEIHLDNAGKRFNYEWIFRNLTHAFAQGESYALLGPNGSGKSTLLQCLAGARLLNEGKISLHSENALVEPEFHYRYISLAAPYLDLIEEFTLKEIMAFHATVKPFEKNVTVEYAAELAKLSNATNKPIKLYSSGMKQRVKLLLAVLSDTPVLLLDEPATNLDAQGLRWYNGLVEERSANRLVIVASNDPQEYAFCKHTIDVTAFKPQR
jgi:ABC-2 type transport system ATP-binding protein